MNTSIEPNIFKEALLDPHTFCITWEQVLGRGVSAKQREIILENVRLATQNKKIHAISITDNPGGSPAYTCGMLGIEIKKLGIEPLVHMALRDKNRNDVEGLLYGLASFNIRNLLALSGDYPSTEGFKGRAQPVFDLDPVHVMQLVSEMNRGLQYKTPGKTAGLAPTDMFAGVAVSPFKLLEAELMCQYYKLQKKLRAGAQFVISQVGYDARKAQELLLWLKQGGYRVPAIANIYVLTYPMAKSMHDNNIPGCVVTGKLLSQLEKERQAPDSGKAARLLRAAKMYAITRGLGYAGAHLGGYGLNHETVEYIIDKGNELFPQWEKLIPEFDYPQAGGFYFFKKDAASGLNTCEPAPRSSKGSRSFIAGFSRLLHRVSFDPQHALFGLSQGIFRRIDHSNTAKKVFEFLEHQGKGLFFDCLRCGDCALIDTAYICPTSQCPKNQRLGSCGGSHDGWCEVYPGKRRCMWVRAYERMKAYNEENTLGEYIIPPRDWDLWQTSSWLNFYMGRDHTAHRLGIKPPEAAPRDR